MKNFTPRQLLREGFKDLLTRAANGESVSITLPSRADGTTSGKSESVYGAKVASKRYRVVAEDI